MNQSNWLKTVTFIYSFFLWKPNKPTKSRDNTIMKFIKFTQLPPPLWCAIFDICPELGNVLLLWWCPLWKPTRPLAPPGGSRFWLLCCKERDISAADVTQVRSSRLEHLESNNRIKIKYGHFHQAKGEPGKAPVPIPPLKQTIRLRLILHFLTWQKRRLFTFRFFNPDLETPQQITMRWGLNKT